MVKNIPEICSLDRYKIMELVLQKQG